MIGANGRVVMKVRNELLLTCGGSYLRITSHRYLRGLMW